MDSPAGGEVFVIDRNYRNGVGGVNIDDDNDIINLRMRKLSKRLLIETGPVATDLVPDEFLVDENGVPLTFASPLKWLGVANDDTTDPVWVRLSSLSGSTVSTVAFKVKAQELLDFDVDRIIDGITQVSLKTDVGTVASCRVFAGM